MVNVHLKKTVDTSYHVRVERGILSRLPRLLAAHPASRYVIVTDGTTKRLFGNALKARLARAGMPALLISVPDGERSKSRTMKERIETAMLRARCDRNTLVIALGGGVVGDLAGFVAATYMRGIRYVQVPTTMLAMIDSSIGGKVGIDTLEGKNTIGAFHQPVAVFADPECLATVPARTLADGVVEGAKMFMTSDALGFASLTKKLQHVLAKDMPALEAFIRRAAAVKAGVVSKDEREAGPRMTLNFGHTVGHALEKLSGYRLAHGSAVALGILVESRAAALMERLPESERAMVESVIVALGVNRAPLKKYGAKAILAAATADKKSVKGKSRYVILTGIGRVLKKGGAYAHPIPSAVITRALSLSR